jgi:hypothetical protein
LRGVWCVEKTRPVSVMPGMRKAIRWPLRWG